MDLECEHCGKFWFATDDAGPAEMTCPVCHALPSESRLAVFLAAKSERAVARARVSWISELQHRVLKRSSYPPASASPVSLERIEREALARLVPLGPPSVRAAPATVRVGQRVNVR